jgi:hypothetical protein
MIRETKTADPGEVVARDHDRDPSTHRSALPRAREALTMAKAYVVTTLKAPRILLGRQRHLLLLSHMRSFTSMLSHILGSHPEICGASELYQPYHDRRDLLKMRYKAYWYSDQKAKVRYFFDKVLFNEFPISDRVLNLPDVKIVFMIRKPAPTIASLVRLAAEFGAKSEFLEKCIDPAHCCDLYVERLRILSEHCMALDKPAVYFDAEDLMDRTDVILGAIRDELGLREPLSEHYRTFRHTGEGGGDMSERIKSGRINRSESHRYDVIIPESPLARAEHAYEQARTLIRERCVCP